MIENTNSCSLCIHYKLCKIHLKYRAICAQVSKLLTNEENHFISAVYCQHYKENLIYEKKND